MKTFGLFMLFFIVTTITHSLLLDGWSTPEVVTQSTVLAYIMQQYFNEKK